MVSPASSTAARFGGTEMACILRIGSRLTSSIEQTTIQVQTNHGDVHQPAPNCSLAASGPSAQIAPAGAGTPTKNSRANDGWLTSSSKALNLASRKTIDTAYSITTTQPAGCPDSIDT
jgi:hypothetical protein